MNSIKSIALVFLVGLFCFSTVEEASAQFPRIGKVKLPTKKKDKDKKATTSNTSSSTSKNTYQANMDEGYKQKEAKNYIAAYKAFNKALELKSGDYSAKKQVGETKNTVEDKYMGQMNTALKSGDCDAVEKDLAIVMDAFGTWYQEKYYKEKIESCKVANKDKATADKKAATAAANASKKAEILSGNKGKALAYTQYKSLDFKTEVKAEEDLMFKFVLNKTLMEEATERGVSTSGKTYLIINMEMAEGKVTAGPFMLDASALTMVDEMDFVMSVVTDEFNKELKSRQSEMGFGDALMLNFLKHSKSTQKRWIRLLAGNIAAGNMVAGKTNDVKMNMYFCKSNTDRKPIGKALASGGVKVKVTENSIKELYSSGRIPENYQPKPDNGLTHDLHKKSLNKIVWSTSEIKKDQTSTSGFKTTFSSLAGGIYGRVYLPKSLRNYGAVFGQPDNCGYFFKFYIDGNEVGSSAYHRLAEKSCNEWTTWQVGLAPKASDDYDYGTPEGFANILKTVKEGTHKVKVEMVLNFLEDGTPNLVKVASSEFTLTTSKSDKAKFVDKHETKVPVGGSRAENRIRITIENKTDKQIDYSIVGDGLSTGGWVYPNQTSCCRVPIGYWLKINDREFHKTTKSDDGKTIVYP
ncbi:MAG: hypothetical protein GY810_18175 [Aureispira sp.]|nr:hypothetical protein [Aureispira sp.]